MNDDTRRNLTTEERPLRADAERNRQRIIEAARAVFAERGLDAPLDAIAERAGVGQATLYRRFPTREDLVVACFAPNLAEYADAVEVALRESDPWIGFCGYVERICGMQAADQGVQDVLTTTFPTARAVEAQRAQSFERLTKLIRRAQDQGSLRADFVTEDVVLLLLANAGVVRVMRTTAPDAWRRFVGLMLDGLRADRAHPLPPPPTPVQTYRAMRRIDLRRG
ncbi:MAG TPA: helix-turn-helix domain-containing protein [Thermomicrobiales bacterium]|nr:helix-turn-helix domain-containing protein [Thermomicrobiales bacterium]